MHLGSSEDDEATVENYQGLLTNFGASNWWDALAIPANWIMLRARRPSTAIKISKTLFGGRYEGLIRAARRRKNLLSKREEGEVAWYGLS